MKKLNAVVDKNGKLLLLSKQNDGDIKTIYTKWLAVNLRDRGFSIVRTHANPNHPELDCWDFIECQELEDAIKDLTK